MDSGRKYTRYAHAEGHTNGGYTDDGKFILTCGSDSDVRVWSCIDDDDPSSLTLREAATSIACRNGVIYVASGNAVQTYQFPDLTFTGKPLRFSAPVTDVDVSSDGNTLVASSCDMKIKVLNLGTNVVKDLEGHTAPVLGVALDPTMKYLGSSSCDGTVRIWNLATGEVVKTFSNALPTGNDFFTAKCLGVPAWQTKTGSHLAVVNENKVNVYTANDFSLAFTLSHPNIQKLMTVVSFSPCGQYLCGASTAGELVVWKLSNRKVVTYLEHPSKAAISGLSWNPSEMEISYCDRLGHLCVVGVNSSKSTEDYASEAVREGNDDDLPTPVTDQNDDDDDENTISINNIKASTGFYSLEDVDGADRGGDDDADGKSDLGSESTYRRAAVPAVDLQPCFQPSATPSHFEYGYMVWNSIGIIRCFNTESESSVDVEFHDSMFHHSLHRSNLYNYTMGTLSYQVLCLASPKKLTAVFLNGWDGTKEWSLDMPDEENAVALAASGNWICCGTDANQLRFFNYTGMQRQVVSVPGPIVCINGHEQLLIAVFHMGTGVPEYQNLGCMIFEVSDFFIRTVSPCHPAPLSPKSRLRWTGFTDEGTPCLYDSAGILRVSRDCLHWEVACNTRQNIKSPSDNYFLLGVSEKYQNVRCILCKGSHYPMTAPRPNVVEMPLRIPLCEASTDRAQQEETFWRHVFSLSTLEELSLENDEYRSDLANWEKLLKQTIIKLFARACRDEADMRAVSIATLMSAHPLEMAIRYAQKDGKMYLIDKLNSIVPKDWSVLSQERTVRAGCLKWQDRGEVARGKPLNRSSQGDMFEDSQPSASRLLLTAQRENTATEDTNDSNGMRSASNKSFNPFKVSRKDDEGLKGLSFFNNVQQSSLKPAKHNTNTVDKTRTKKSPKAAAEPPQQQPKKMKFVDWFQKNKATLQSENPDLTPNELTKLGMKLFREMKTGQEILGRENDSQNVGGERDPSPEAKRMKLESPKSGAKVGVSEKLSAFNFRK